MESEIITKLKRQKVTELVGWDKEEEELSFMLATTIGVRASQILNFKKEKRNRQIRSRKNSEDSHSSRDASGHEGLADAEDRVAGSLDSLPRELRLLRKIHDRRHRRLSRALPHHILRCHKTLQQDRIGRNPKLDLGESTRLVPAIDGRQGTKQRRSVSDSSGSSPSTVREGRRRWRR
ncbi:hypothetical protein BHE74_00003526 [Ensete ventricosum]|nr:hypothetical protein BHE74_00003526 [Ensete ventricosum]RZR81360.1 hypothetical protein BHM03_00007572 [Ensete ventricosum]